MSAAIEILTERKFSELPVVDRQGRPLGMIDVTDVVGMLPHSARESQFGPHFDAVREPALVRLYDGDESPGDVEFVWPFAEMPETD
jgi:CBS domain containing-hemolysin-like protein